MCTDYAIVCLYSLASSSCQTYIYTFPRAGYDQIPCKVVGYVPHGIGAGEFNREVTVSSARDRGVSQAAAYALAAAEEALTGSGWKPQKDAQLERTGVCAFDLWLNNVFVCGCMSTVNIMVNSYCSEYDIC